MVGQDIGSSSDKKLLSIVIDDDGDGRVRGKRQS